MGIPSTTAAHIGKLQSYLIEESILDIDAITVGEFDAATQDAYHVFFRDVLNQDQSRKQYSEPSYSYPQAVQDTLDAHSPEALDGYAVAFDADYTLETDADDVTLNITGMQVGATYSYSIASSGGGTAVTGMGTASVDDFAIGGIDCSGLTAGTLTVTFIGTSVFGGVGDAVTDTATLSPSA